MSSSTLTPGLAGEPEAAPVGVLRDQRHHLRERKVPDGGYAVGLDVRVGGRDVGVDPGGRRVHGIDRDLRLGQARVIRLFQLQVGLDVGGDGLLGGDVVRSEVRERRGRGVGRGHGRGRSDLEVPRVGGGDGVAVLVDLGLAGLLVDDLACERLADDLRADELAVHVHLLAVRVAGERDLAHARNNQRVQNADQQCDDEDRERSADDVFLHGFSRGVRSGPARSGRAAGRGRT